MVYVPCQPRPPNLGLEPVVRPTSFVMSEIQPCRPVVDVEDVEASIVSASFGQSAAKSALGPRCDAARAEEARHPRFFLPVGIVNTAKHRHDTRRSSTSHSSLESEEGNGSYAVRRGGKRSSDGRCSYQYWICDEPHEAHH